jgi:hypothetical protein
MNAATLNPRVAAVQARNMAACPSCYCYVCDIPTADCEDWTSHCMAASGDARWDALRRAKKAGLPQPAEFGGAMDFIPHPRGVNFQGQRTGYTFKHGARGLGYYKEAAAAAAAGPNFIPHGSAPGSGPARGG